MSKASNHTKYKLRTAAHHALKGIIGIGIQLKCLHVTSIYQKKKKNEMVLGYVYKISYVSALRF